MTAPFAPQLTSPASKGAASTTTVTLKAKYRSGVAGDPGTTIAWRRRAMTPSIGSYEWWNGTTWVGSETFIATVPASVPDSTEAAVTITTGWTADKTYQWSAKMRNGASEASPYATDFLINTHALPSMATSISSTASSRPKVLWVSTIAANNYQSQYQIAIYTNAIKTAVGFDPSLPAWQALATYLSPVGYSSFDYSKQVGADLLSGTQYWIYYTITDSSNLSSGWTVGATFTPSFTAFPAPTLILTPDLANGNMGYIVRSAFNLLSENQSSFTSGIAGWLGTLNCQTEFPNNGTLLIRAGGMSYAALDTAQTDYTATDTAYADYTAMTNAQASPAGTSRAQSGIVTGEMVPVSPSTIYSATFDAICSVGSRTVKCGIRWYTSGGAPATTAINQGTGVVMSTVSYLNANVLSATSPANAAFAAVEVEWTTSAVGDVVNVKNVALAAAASIAWSPTGSAFDVSFTLEKTRDGVNWESVWGLSPNNPKISDIGVLTQVIGTDRAAFLGQGSVSYRAYAVSKYSTAPLWSSGVVQAVAPMTIDGWRIRSTTDSTKDIYMPISKFSYSAELNNDVVAPEGLPYPIVLSNDQPSVGSIMFNVTVKTQAAFEKLMAALNSNVTMYLQTNRAGVGYYFRPTSAIKADIRQRIPDLSDTPYSTVGTFFDVSVQGVIVKPYEG